MCFVLSLLALQQSLIFFSLQFANPAALIFPPQLTVKNRELAIADCSSMMQCVLTSRMERCLCAGVSASIRSQNRVISLFNLIQIILGLVLENII